MGVASLAQHFNMLSLVLQQLNINCSQSARKTTLWGIFLYMTRSLSFTDSLEEDTGKQREEEEVQRDGEERGMTRVLNRYESVCACR